MKRIDQLQNLSREHHLSLTLAQKAIRVSEGQDSEAISALCQEIVHDYSGTWRIHFKIEEDSIFQLFSDQDNTSSSFLRLKESSHFSEIVALCHQLQQEHQTMDDYYEQMKRGDYSLLGQFGTLLKKHTRTEERQLFPLLEEVLTKEALDHVFQVSRDYRLQVD